MEHQGISGPAEKRTEVVAKLASLDHSKKCPKDIKTAEPSENTVELAEKHTKALKTVEPVGKHKKTVEPVGKLKTVEHQGISEPAEKRTEVVEKLASLDHSKKCPKDIKTAEPSENTVELAEKHTKALNTVEPVGKHKKVVVKLDLLDDSKRMKAMKTVTAMKGIESAALDRDRDRDRLVVVCDGTDEVALTNMLRKKLGYAELVSVTSYDDRIREEKESKVLSGSKSGAGAPSPYQYGYMSNPVASCKSIESVLKSCSII